MFDFIFGVFLPIALFYGGAFVVIFLMFRSLGEATTKRPAKKEANWAEYTNGDLEKEDRSYGGGGTC
jgi:hypothetical protein